MKLTIINQFFPPDLSPTAHIAASLAEHRADLGDEVTIVTSASQYVTQSVEATSSPFPRLAIRKLWAPDLGRRTLFRRVLDYVSFYLMALWEAVRLPPQDVVIPMTTPPLIAWVAILHKVLHRRSRVLLWNMDCYPDVLERARLIRHDGLISNLLGMFTSILFRHLDQVICLDDAMRDLLRARYAKRAPHLQFKVIPNWEPLALFPKPVVRISREASSSRELTVLYLGNAGVGHTFDAVLEAGGLLEKSSTKFVFVGGGAQWQTVKEGAARRGLSRFSFESYIAKERTPELLARCDLGLITLKDEMAGVMSPSKLHSYLAMGLPVIYMGPERTNVDEAIRKFGCGVSLRADDALGMAAFLRDCERDLSKLEVLSARARAAFEQGYSDLRIAPQFDSIINSSV